MSIFLRRFVLLFVASFALVGALTASAHAANLSPQARLRKLSLHLRGVMPSDQEYEELKTVARSRDSVAENQHFEMKAAEYLRSPQHVGKMTDRLDSLFRVKTSEGLPEGALNILTAPSSSPPPGNEALNAMDQLFQELAIHNQSWDMLLTGRKYSFLKTDRFNFNRPSDLGFFNAAAPQLPPSSDGVVKIPPAKVSDAQASLPYDLTLLSVEFPEDDPRIAGVVTTNRFIGRYSTTNLNKNRGRAAALFRIFLCDDMKPVIVAKDEDTERLLNEAFAGKGGAGTPSPTPGPSNMPGPMMPVHATAEDEKRHGSEPACMSCHYKLDPMGQSFQTTGIVLSPEAAPGALVFKREDGSLVNVPGRGLGDLAKAIVGQPEYASCQVQHFWRWFIGDDLPLTRARRESLAAEFNRLGRRTNDFIAHLVKQPEFIRARDEDEVMKPTLLNVKPIFMNCNSCHSGADESIPDFTKLPMGGTSATQLTWMKQISDSLDLANEGRSRTMPPKYSVWQPTAQDLSLVKQWMAAGAPDENGIPTSEPLGPIVTGPVLPPLVNFQGSSTRYLSAHDLFRVFAQKFPDGFSSVPQSCRHLVAPDSGVNNRALSGDPLPAEGEPLVKAPSPAFVRWLAGCFMQLAKADLEAIRGKEGSAIERYFGPDAKSLISASPAALALTQPQSVAWVQLPIEARKQTIQFLLRVWFGGSWLYRESKEAQWVNQLSDALVKAGPELNTQEALIQLVLMLGIRDEFLSY